MVHKNKDLFFSFKKKHLNKLCFQDHKGLEFFSINFSAYLQNFEDSTMTFWLKFTKWIFVKQLRFKNDLRNASGFGNMLKFKLSSNSGNFSPFFTHFLLPNSAKNYQSNVNFHQNCIMLQSWPGFIKIAKSLQLCYSSKKQFLAFLT